MGIADGVLVGIRVGVKVGGLHPTRLKVTLSIKKLMSPVRVVDASVNCCHGYRGYRVGSEGTGQCDGPHNHAVYAHCHCIGRTAIQPLGQ